MERAGRCAAGVGVEVPGVEGGVKAGEMRVGGRECVRWRVRSWCVVDSVGRGRGESMGEGGEGGWSDVGAVIAFS